MKPVLGGLLTHKRDSRDWRLRKFRDSSDNHPIDPNWETGMYMRCHPDARQVIREGTDVEQLPLALANRNRNT